MRVEERLPGESEEQARRRIADLRSPMSDDDRLLINRLNAEDRQDEFINNLKINKI